MLEGYVGFQACVQALLCIILAMCRVCGPRYVTGMSRVAWLCIKTINNRSQLLHATTSAVSTCNTLNTLCCIQLQKCIVQNSQTNCQISSC